MSVVNPETTLVPEAMMACGWSDSCTLEFRNVWRVSMSPKIHKRCLELLRPRQQEDSGVTAIHPRYSLVEFKRHVNSRKTLIVQRMRQCPAKFADTRTLAQTHQTATSRRDLWIQMPRVAMFMAGCSCAASEISSSVQQFHRVSSNSSIIITQ